MKEPKPKVLLNDSDVSVGSKTLELQAAQITRPDDDEDDDDDDDDKIWVPRTCRSVPAPGMLSMRHGVS